MINPKEFLLPVLIVLGCALAGVALLTLLERIFA